MWGKAHQNEQTEIFTQNTKRGLYVLWKFWRHDKWPLHRRRRGNTLAVSNGRWYIGIGKKWGVRRGDTRGRETQRALIFIEEDLYPLCKPVRSCKDRTATQDEKEGDTIVNMRKKGTRLWTSIGNTQANRSPPPPPPSPTLPHTLPHKTWKDSTVGQG